MALGTRIDPLRVQKIDSLGTRLAVHVVNSRSRLRSNLVPRPMIVVFGLGTRLHVRMRTTLENGILRNRQQLQSAVNGFY